jgi:hypothetical protein
LSLTLREEHRLRVFKNRVQRIFGPKRDEVAGGWRRLHNEELHNLYLSSNMRVIKLRRMRWAGHIACKMRNADKILVGKPEGKRPLRRPRDMQEDYIRVDLQQIGWEGMYWIHLAQVRDQWLALVNTVMNLQVS